jgi:hypothetical protein
MIDILNTVLLSHWADGTSGRRQVFGNLEVGVLSLWSEVNDII